MSEATAALPGETPVPERPRAPRAFALGTLLVATFAALALPGQRPGLGALVVGVAVGILAVAHAWPPSPWALAMWGLALGLAAMVVLRAAPWLVGLDLAAALGLGGLAVLGSSRWSELTEAPLIAAARALRAPGFLLRALPLDSRPSLSPALRGGAIAAVLLIVFGSLFATADRAFAELARDYLVPAWNLELLPMRLFAFASVATVAGTLGLLAPRHAHLEPHPATEEGGLEAKAPRRLTRLEWLLPLALLDLLFAAFVAIQATFLFRETEHVVETVGLTYAEYARQGFFQLLAVGALTLAVVAGAARWAGRASRRDDLVLRALLGVLCALTLVVLASALHRLAMYEEVFGLTLARLVAHETALWIGGLIGLVAIAGATLRAGWLPRAAVVFSAAVLLGASISDPEARIAEVNVDRWRETGKIDLDYLATLGPDAIPPIAELPPRLRACALPTIGVQVRPRDGLWGLNLARDRAADVLLATSKAPAPCRYPD